MEPTVHKGSVIVYRVFDIAEEINLHEVERLLSQLSGGESRLKLAAKTRDAVIVRNAPVRVGLGEVNLAAENMGLQKPELVATIWDYGAVSIAFKFPILTPRSWDSMLLTGSFLNSDEAFISSLESIAKERCMDLSQAMKPALRRPVLWEISEDYLLYFIEDVRGFENTEELMARGNIAELLLGEPKASLSPLTEESILENTFQYAENDFAIIDWNSAFVLEPTGTRDIPDVIEFAVTHLLEVRYYDELLDRRLTELYDSVEAGRGRVIRNQFAKISREANTRYMEFTEIMERMENSLKVVGDFYLARIFRGAIRRFRIADWEESITRKVNLLARVSELLQGETNVRRSLLLEIIIMLLILFEILQTSFSLH